jgi:hypothetical protein
MSKNIIICRDGTSNEVKASPTAELILSHDVGRDRLTLIPMTTKCDDCRLLLDRRIRRSGGHAQQTGISPMLPPTMAFRHR